MPNLRKTGEREGVGGVEKYRHGPHGEGGGRRHLGQTWLQAGPHVGWGGKVAPELGIGEFTGHCFPIGRGIEQCNGGGALGKTPDSWLPLSFLFCCLDVEDKASPVSLSLGVKWAGALAES